MTRAKYGPRLLAGFETVVWGFVRRRVVANVASGGGSVGEDARAVLVRTDLARTADMNSRMVWA